jgi:hypothetical protein
MLLFFWLVLLVFGGGSRGDIQSTLFLRPLAVLLIAYSCVRISKIELLKFPFVLMLIVSSFLLLGIQLIPLPYGLWSSLPGHAIIAETDKLVGLGEIWRPISMHPTSGRNSYFSFLIPLALFILLLRVDRETRYHLLGITIMIGILNAVIGLLQLLGPDHGALYFYRITNFGAAVGLFANRNHFAVFLACLIPMLAVFASKRFPSQRFRLIAATLIGTFLFLLIIVAGSRAGFLVGGLGIAASPFLYEREARKGSKTAPVQTKALFFRLSLVAFVITFTLALALSTSRAVSFDRLLGSDGGSEGRFEFWGPILRIAWTYFPFGSGFGTFVDVYKMHEATASLSPEYLNHAHNDLIEIAMTGGLAALFILFAAFVGWTKTSYQLFFKQTTNSRATLFGKLGSLIVLMLSIASLSDYPLRTPSLTGLLIIAAIWMAAGVKNVTAGQSH